ncbi:membrane insertase cox18 [Rhizopus stolonifer]|uniref:Membrane insertase cox18 n=1 Tax=Rhizopus stolonifer TaxID=4846 RepID=A0A367IV26_RHIST|nr:membrane insertase cox18 [Rhizopus stolonifer]
MYCSRKKLLYTVQKTSHIYCHAPVLASTQHHYKPLLLSTGLTVAHHHEATEVALPSVLAFNEQIIHIIHNTGLPWWATIVSSTILLRSCLTFPIAVYQQQSIGKMINLAPMVQSWGETLKTQVGKQSVRQGWHYTRYQAELQKRYSQKVKEIYAHYGCSRWKLLLLPYIQIPLFVSMSLSLRHVAAMPLPWWGQTAETPASGLSDEGLGWFMDLTVADPTMMVPFLIGAGNLINVELNAWYANKAQSKKQTIITNVLRGVSIAFVPIAAQTPMAIGLYWLSSAWYSVAQNLAFRLPAVRTALKMPLLNNKKPMDD